MATLPLASNVKVYRGHAAAERLLSTHGEKHVDAKARRDAACPPRLPVCRWAAVVLAESWLEVPTRSAGEKGGE